MPIRLYQWVISPFFGSNCRFVPTCSEYTAEAMKEWGAIRGFWIGLKRIVRCNPWGGHGHDPVPKKTKE